MEEYDFLLNRRIEIILEEKIDDKIKEYRAEGYVPYIKYGGPSGAKIYLIRDNGFVGWFYPNKKNVLDLNIKIMNWRTEEKKEKVSRAELLDLEE